MIKNLIIILLGFYSFSTYGDVGIYHPLDSEKNKKNLFLKSQDKDSAPVSYKLLDVNSHVEKMKLLCFGAQEHTPHLNTELVRDDVLPDLFHIKHDALIIKGDFLQRKNIKKEKTEIKGAKIDFIFKE